MRTHKVVILAAGRGRRMRYADDQSHLNPEQEAVARTGVKALIPIERPFLDYTLSRLADAGCDQICLVVAPHHEEMRHYYENVAVQRLSIEFAVQQRPLGTADAVAAAAEFVRDEPFLVINSDNCYPTSALRQLSAIDGDAVVGFDPERLIADGNIPADRVARYSLIEQDERGYLRRITEKADPTCAREAGRPILVGMNCWRFSPEILDACRKIDRSPRNEYELPDAVMYSISTLGRLYRVVPSDQGVLDLSHRRDIAAVAARLEGQEVRL